MATGTITNSSSISDIETTFVGEAQVGSNGTNDEYPEYDITDYNGNGVDGSIVWDSNLSEGFDTGWVPATLDVEPGGSITWTLTIEGAAPLIYTGLSYGNISALCIRAAVQTAASSAWRQISVKFYQSGVQTDSYSLRAGPQVNLNGSSLPVAGEQVLWITPNTNTNTKVVVTGQFRFTNASTSPPDPEDMFAQIFVDTSF